MSAPIGQAAALLAVAVTVTLGVFWGLFLTRTRAEPAMALSPTLRQTLAGVASIALMMGFLALYWDASLRVKTGQVPGVAASLWPPHAVLYAAFAALLLAGLSGLMIAGAHAHRADPRVAAAALPEAGVIALAALLALLCYPADLRWRLYFGAEVLGWTPSTAVSVIALVAAAGASVSLIWRAQAAPRSRGTRLWTAGLLAMVSALLYFAACIDLEFPGGISLSVAARPGWLYTTLGGLTLLIGPAIARHRLSCRWAATLTSLIAHLLRAAVMGWLAGVGSLPPLVPVISLLGAVLLDVSGLLRIENVWQRRTVQAAAYALGHTAVAWLFALSQPYLSLLQSDSYLGASVTLAGSFVILWLTEALAAAHQRSTRGKYISNPPATPASV